MLKMKKHRHVYDYEPKPHSAGSKVMRMVGEGRRVLELGPGPGAITRLLHARHCRVTALELDPAAIQIVTPYCEQVIAGDLNDPAWPDALANAGQFERIVAADVLEHLYDPWTTLRSLRPLLAEGGCVIVSLPHLGHSAVLAGLMEGHFDYGPWGLLDRTHIRFFGIHNIQRLFEGAGFKIIEADFVVKDPSDTEFARQWRQLPEESRAVLSRGRFATIYQVVVKAVPIASPGDGLQLTALRPPPAPREPLDFGAMGRRLRAYLVSLLSLQTRQRIAEMGRRLGHRR
jgi:2-polyprenyl-3-methyl-5-hydroxy-6-metoxy-1,4-benzoquinol methylase